MIIISANTLAQDEGDDTKTIQSEPTPEPEVPAAPAEGVEPSAEIGQEYVITDKYVHQWIPFPSIKGRSLPVRDKFSYKPIKGKAVVVIFIASWCKPCQALMSRFMALQEKYGKLHTDFIFVFSHDTRKDATAFIKQLGMKGYMVEANHKILKSFKEPALPAIYIGDRHNWLAKRILQVKPKHIAGLDDYLRGINAM